jgi:hypothetical protein
MCRQFDERQKSASGLPSNLGRLTLPPFPTDPGEAFATRLSNATLAGAYAVGALRLTTAPRPQLEESRP